MIEDMREKRDALEEKLSAISPDQERKALGLSFRGILGKKGTLFAEVLEMAHVKDGAAIYDIREIPRGSSTFISIKVLPAIDPDVILLPVWQSGMHMSESERYKFVMSQHITDAVEASAKAVYPELFDHPDSMTVNGN